MKLHSHNFSLLGTYLINMLENIARKVTDKKMTPAQKTELKLGIGKNT